MKNYLLERARRFLNHLSTKELIIFATAIKEARHTDGISDILYNFLTELLTDINIEA